MTKRESKAEVVNLKELLATDQDYLRKMVETIVQATLEAEMTEAVSAEKSERTPARLSYRSGYYSRSLITRVGTLELRVPQDRQGRFSTELFERYQRAEKALIGHHPPSFTVEVHTVTANHTETDGSAAAPPHTGDSSDDGPPAT